MTLRDLAPINALAEARITERYTLAHALTMMHGTIPGGYVRDRAIDVAVELNLLCDLTRPDSMDALARLVAAKVGIECGATAPQWAQEEYHVDGERTACWILSSKDRSVVFYGDYDSGPDGYSVYRRVSGVDNITDPAEALRLIALVVLA